MTAKQRIRTALVTGATGTVREAMIAAALEPGVATAVILEGLPDGASQLDHAPGVHDLHIARIAPGCLCCTGNLTMRVTLNRLLRRQPTHLYIGLANTTHLESLRTFLRQPPYDALLYLAQELHG